jgi:hypothetical protein
VNFGRWNLWWKEVVLGFASVSFWTLVVVFIAFTWAADEESYGFITQ